MLGGVPWASLFFLSGALRVARRTGLATGLDGPEEPDPGRNEEREEGSEGSAGEHRPVAFDLLAACLARDCPSCEMLAVVLEQAVAPQSHALKRPADHGAARKCSVIHDGDALAFMVELPQIESPNAAGVSTRRGDDSQLPTRRIDYGDPVVLDGTADGEAARRREMVPR